MAELSIGPFQDSSQARQLDSTCSGKTGGGQRHTHVESLFKLIIPKGLPGDRRKIGLMLTSRCFGGNRAEILMCRAVRNADVMTAPDEFGAQPLCGTVSGALGGLPLQVTYSRQFDKRRAVELQIGRGKLGMF